MGIKGYLNPNTYCSIANIVYEKELSRCTVVVQIFENDQKKYIVGSTSIVVDGGFLENSLISLTPQKTIPENLGDSFFLIADDPDDSLKGLEGRVGFIHKVTKELHTHFFTEFSFFTFYLIDEDKYVKFVDNKWETLKNVTKDKRIWDKWFAPEVALAEGTNPTKQMYKFMKTLEQFKDCVDA